MHIPQIVGIAGTNGSGKDTLGELLRERHDYEVVSLSDILRAELDVRGQEHTRENLSALSKSIREREGDGAMSASVIANWEQGGTDQGLCITSIRMPGEAREIQQAGGIVVWVDADPQVRYERIRAGNRSRGATDDLSFDEFMEQQAREMTPSEKGGGLNMAAVRELADVHVVNEFSSLDEYRAYLVTTFEL